MRIYWLISIVVMMGTAGCVAEKDPAESRDLAAQAPVTGERGEGASSFVGPSCTARSPCLSPYNGTAVTCSGSSSCFPYSDHVTCDDVSTNCAACVCNCNPALECCKPAGCGTNCYVYATSGCL